MEYMEVMACQTGLLPEGIGPSDNRQKKIEGRRPRQIALT